jgi:hypothetical protein
MFNYNGNNAFVEQLSEASFLDLIKAIKGQLMQILERYK